MSREFRLPDLGEGVSEGQIVRVLVSEGEVLDTEPLKINESYMIVHVEQPVKQYFKQLMQHGFSHHSIVAPGRVSDHLECFARQLDIEVCRL